MKYISKKNVEILDKLSFHSEWLYLIKNRLIENDDSLPNHFKEKGAAYYDGMLQGTYGAIQSILGELKAYNGFSYRYPDNCADGLECYCYGVKPKPHGAHMLNYEIVKHHRRGTLEGTETTEQMRFVSHNSASHWRDGISLNCQDYIVTEMYRIH